MATVDVPKDADGNDVPVLALFENPDGVPIWAHTPADVVQYQAQGWREIDTAQTGTGKAGAAKEAPKADAGAKEGSGGK
jgi:hypothetical protein